MKTVPSLLAAIAAAFVGLSFWPVPTESVGLPPRREMPPVPRHLSNAPKPDLLSYHAAAASRLEASRSQPELQVVQGPEPAGSHEIGSVHTRFANWFERYLALAWSEDPAPLLAEGEDLARARRAALALEIEANPRAALEHAAPYRWREMLPDRITRHFERPISGLARFEVFTACPPPGEDYTRFQHPPYRYATVGGRQYRAFVYSSRVAQMSHPSLPICGIAVDDVLALHEDPARLLEPEEAADLVAAKRVTADSACAVCGATSHAPAFVELAGTFVAVCSRAHGDVLNGALRRGVSLQGPGVTLAGPPVWTNPPPVAPAAAYGTRQALYMRLVFRDDTTVPISSEQAAAEMEQVNDFFIENSYSKTAVLATVTPVLTLPQPKAFYAASGPGRLMSDAQAEAANAGFASADYQLLLARFTPVPGFNWGGLGGGSTAWLQYNGAGLAIHEIGHCYGLGHANAWDTRRASLPAPPPDRFDADSVIGHDSILGAGDDLEYGDPFDVMGGGGGEAQTPTNRAISGFTGHINPIGKMALDWLPAAGVLDLTSSGTNRLHVFDTPVLEHDRIYALRVKKDAQRTYWVSARNRITDNPWITNGVSLHWSQWPQSIGYSTLLDTTPGTAAGRQDSALQLGRTYSDDEAGVHITPIARGGTDGDSWYDVVVNVAPPTNNSPPVAALSVTTNQVAPGTAVTFAVEATDPDGDPLAFYWEVSDGSHGPNAPTLTRSWTQPGDYRVRVEVSDLKGHMVCYHQVVRVGRPADSYRISGRVLDDRGVPVVGVRVANGALTNATELATDFQATFTDSDGAFTLINQAPGDKEVTAYKAGYRTSPQNFNQFVTVDDQPVTDLAFLALPQPRVSVRTAQPADLTKGAPGILTFSRTGDTNTALRALYVLGGAATTNDYVAPTNRTVQTNTVRTLLANVNLAIPFYVVDFATGVVQTNITIRVATNAAAADTALEASVMYALQTEATYLTNVDDGNGGTTNLLATNFTFLTGWEVLPMNGQDTWFQTVEQFVVGSPGTTTLALQGVKATKPAVSILALDPVASENGGDAALLALVRTGVTNVPVTVHLSFAGTATYDADYEPLPSLVVIPAGVTFLRLPVYVRPDLYLEGNETLQVTIQPDATYSLGTAKVEVVIGDNDLPTVTIVANDPVASETGSDTASAVVTRIGDLTDDLTVNYLAGGTATSGQDYRALPGSVVIPAGQPSATILIQPRNNGRADGGNTLDLMLSDNPTYNVGAPGTATVFLQDGALPTVGIRARDAEAAEPDDPGEFVVWRAGDRRSDLPVSLAVGGTARPVADYGSIASLGVIPAGATSVVIRVSPVNDAVREDPETVVCQILPSPNYNLTPALADQQATVTIADDDGSGSLGVGFTFAGSQVIEGTLTGFVAVSISANPAPDSDVTVDWRLAGGTAVPGLDYLATNVAGRLVFSNAPDAAISNRVLLIPFPILDDKVAEPEKTLVFTLVEPAPLVSNEVVTNTITLTNAAGEEIGSTNVLTTNVIITPIPMNAVLDVYRSHTLTIVDDDAAQVGIEVVNGIATEQDRTPGLLRIRRSGSLVGDQLVKLSVSGSASSGSDFEPLPASVIIPNGESSVDLPVYPVDDPIQEFMEEVIVRVVEAPGAVVSSDASVATVRILDNDGTVEFSTPSYAASEGAGQAVILVRRTSDPTLSVSVAYAATAGTATAADFQPTNGIVSFVPGETEKSFYVDLIDDRQVEEPETVLLSLRNLSDGVPLGGQTTAQLTIVDDDTVVEFVATNIVALENQTNVAVAVYRYGIVTNRLELELELAADTNGTAIPWLDFVPTNYPLVFAPGQTTAVAQVRLLNDVEFDGDKFLPLVLTNLEPSATLGTNRAGGLLIRDDECALQLAATDYVVDEYARTLEVTVERTGGTIHPVQFSYETRDGTSLATRDYVTARGTLTLEGDQIAQAPDGSGVVVLEPGQTNLSFTLRILDDVIGEGDETFLIAITNARVVGTGLPSGTVVLGSNTLARVTIRDNETPGSVDFEFNPGAGANDTVLALARQPDAKILAAGRFTEMDQVALSRLARLHPDGYLDSFLNPGEGFDGETDAVAVQADGRILVAGDFTQLNSEPAPRLIRLNADGLRDPDFNVGTGANGPVLVLALQPDGQILAGGDFTRMATVSRAHLARLSADGGVDADFAPEFDNAVLALAVQPDGSILAAGRFTTLGGVRAPYLTRLNPDGTRDPAFNPGTGPDQEVQAIALQTDGRILIGGSFKTVNGIARAGLARLHADGSLDVSFDPGGGFNDVVHAVGLAADGKILAGGEFTAFNGAEHNRIVRLNPNGSLDMGFEVGAGANGAVRALVVEPDTAIVIGGDFTEVKGLPRNRIARLHGDEKFTVNAVQFAAAIYRVKENEGPAVITVTRSGDLASTLTVGYLTWDGTAHAGADYTPVQGTLTFDPNVTVRTFQVPVLDDAIGEGDEAFSLSLTNLPPGFSTTVQLETTVVIEDNESAVSFALADYVIEENAGQARISVRRTGPTNTVVRVDYATQDGTAVAGKDYLPSTGTLEFAAGAVEESFTVGILDNPDLNPDRTVRLTLGNPQGGAVLGSLAAATLTITDNDRVDQFALNLTPPVGGTVTPPSGSYPAGSTQVITAIPEHGFGFQGWEGTVSSAINPLVLVMDRDYLLTARFAPLQYSYTFEPPFKATDLWAPPWSSSSTRPWQLESGTASAGSYAVRSGLVADGQVSTLQLAVDSRGGAAAFDLRVSSEANWDFAEFLVDGVRVQRWSGDVPWRTFVFNLPAGPHALAWRYSKDNNFTSGQDAMFLDNLYVPSAGPDPTDPAAYLRAVRIPGGFQLWLTGKPGLTYTVEQSPDLVNWSVLGSVVNTSGTVVMTVELRPDLPPAYYRAVTTP